MKSNLKISFIAAILLSVQVAHAATPSQGTFDSPESGVKALAEAVKSKDKSALKSIFGKDSEKLLSSGDPVQDENARGTFTKLYNESNKIEKTEDGRVTLLLGQDDWPFPIPLVSSGTKWHFDTEEGLNEIVNRRIGKNELNSISLAQTYIKAQQEYYSRDRDNDGFQEYAQVFASSPGKKNGLFWPRQRGDGPSPLATVALEAWSEGYMLGKNAGPLPYHGYFFRILTKQGPNAHGGAKNYMTPAGRMSEGYAMLAYPAKWGTSGIMSFMVNQDGIVYQKDLGANTESAQAFIKEFDPDSSWEKVEKLKKQW